MSKQNEHPRSLLMAGLYLAALIIAFVMIKAEYARDLRVSEARGAATVLGEERLIDSLKTGNDVFAALFKDSGIIKWSYEIANSNRNSKAPLFNQERVSDSMLTKTDAFWEMTRLAIQRLVFILYWLPVLIPFIIAATVDGAMAREIRKWRFQFTSTTVYNFSRKMAGTIVFVVLLLPVIPIKMPVLVYPIAIMLCALTVWASIANMQKRI
jgi:hypothetical protein